MRAYYCTQNISLQMVYGKISFTSCGCYFTSGILSEGAGGWFGRGTGKCHQHGYGHISWNAIWAGGGCSCCNERRLQREQSEREQREREQREREQRDREQREREQRQSEQREREQREREQREREQREREQREREQREREQREREREQYEHKHEMKRECEHSMRLIKEAYKELCEVVNKELVEKLKLLYDFAMVQLRNGKICETIHYLELLETYHKEEVQHRRERDQENILEFRKYADTLRPWLDNEGNFHLKLAMVLCIVLINLVNN